MELYLWIMFAVTAIHTLSSLCKLSRTYPHAIVYSPWVYFLDFVFYLFLFSATAVMLATLPYTFNRF